MTTEQIEMPGLMLGLFDPNLKWHAIQVTIGEWATAKGKSVEATIQCKMDKSERWGNCALMLKMKLQGRSRNTRKQEYDLTELCVKHNELDVRDFMLSKRARLGDEVAAIASNNNPSWKQAYLRSGFGREPGVFIPGRPGYKPLNPAVFGFFDRGSMTFGLQIGNFKHITTLPTKLSAAQKAKGFIAHDLWLLDPLQFTPTIGESANERLARFMTNKALT
jgi:hypothetical protein|tara:strand:- start:1476 stop:2135 length:660 start_codon:yes stop_codon:yes gene_type:complete